MNRDLLLALLSMDAYNRGYGTHIVGLGNTGSLGAVTIIDIPLPSGSIDAGFYGIAYTAGTGITGIASGDKIVSYRGTNPDTIANFFGDALNGYGLGGGSPYSTQSRLAIEFYRASVGVQLRITVRITVTVY